MGKPSILHQLLFMADVDHREFAGSIGMHPGQLSRVLRGRVTPTRLTRARLAEGLRQLIDADNVL